MEKHRWMIEVVDDLTFYAVANNLSDIVSQLKAVRAQLEDTLAVEESNVIEVEFMRKDHSSCA